MKKSVLLKSLALIMLLCLSIVSLTACLDLGSSVKITFMVDGEVYTVMTVYGQNAHQLPKDPKKEDCVFDGWYLDNESWESPYYGTPSDTTTGTVTVYGKWSAIPCGHTWSDWQILSFPTCIDDGVRARTCATCGKLDNEVIAKLEHNLKHRDGKNATCMEEGYKPYDECTRCDYTTYETVGKGNHRPKTAVVENRVDSTCELSGRYESVVYCTDCGKELSREMFTLKKLEHNYGTPSYTWNSDNTTCTATRVCANDGSHKETETVNVVKTVTQNKTCTLDELSTYSATFKNSAFATQKKENVKTADKLNHNYGEVSYVWNSDNTTCTATRVCSNDTSHKETENVTAIKTVTQNKTCTLDELSNCSATFKNSAFATQKKENVKTANKLGHKNATAVEENKVEATCEKEGSYDSVIYCSVCSTKLSTVYKTIGKLGHDFSDNADYCKTCNAAYFTEGLTYTLVQNDGGNYYKVIGKGTATDTRLVIPSTYNGLPVKEVASRAFNGWLDLVTAVVPNSVTSIGSSAFSGCSSLESITLPFVGNRAGVTENDTYQYPLGYIFSENYYDGGTKTQQYYYGNSTTSITYDFYYIPSTLKTVTITCGNILYGAFYNCSKLTSVTIGNGVTSIGDYAFYCCDGLTSVTIGDSVTLIGDCAFQNCIELKGVYISDIAAWCNIGFATSINYNRHYSNPLYYAHNLYLNNVLVTDLVIPNKVATIKDYAFYSATCLQSITIPDSIITIGNSAFESCSGLTSITIPDSIITIGSYAFYNCSKLTSITIPDSVTSIGYGAFSGCSSLESITLPFVGNRAGVTENDTYQYPFGYIFGTDSYTGGTKTLQYYYGNSTTSTTSSYYYIPSSLKSVTITGGDILYGAFEDCSGLTSVTIPDSVTSIGSSAFYNCSGLISITIPDSVTSIGSHAFYGCYKLVEVINKSHLNITKGSSSNGYVGYCALNVKTEGTSDIVNVNDYLFYTYNNVNYLLGYVGNDTELVLPDNYNGQNYEIYQYAFNNCSRLTSITIPNSVTSIGDRAFSVCGGLTSVTIGNSVTSIGSWAFDGCPIETATIPAIACSYIKNSKLKTVVITSGATIGSYAFSGCSGLTSVTIGNSVTSIGEYAFYGCSGLTSITIPDSVTSIGSFAFRDCSGLESIVVAEGNKKYKSINNCLIETATKTLILGCKNSIIPNDGSVTSIGDDAFWDCSGLTSVTIPDSVTSIGGWAFYGCSGLRSLTIGNSVTSIGNWAFYNCSGLTRIDFSGTKAQWNAIKKGSDWKYYTGSITVYCTDGSISI